MFPRFRYHVRYSLLGPDGQAAVGDALFTANGLIRDDRDMDWMTNALKAHLGPDFQGMTLNVLSCDRLRLLAKPKIDAQ